MRYFESLTVTLLAVVLCAEPAFAQPASAPAGGPTPAKGAPPGKGAGENAPGKDRPMLKGAGPGAHAREAHQKAMEAARERREAAKDKALQRREGHREMSAAFKARMDKLRETRKARRDAHRKELKAKWGPLAERAPMLAELKRHAWRMARLKRMQGLAEELDKPELLARVNKLIEQEQARHAERMEQLKKTAPGNADKAAADAPKPAEPAAAPAKVDPPKAGPAASAAPEAKE